MAAEDILFFQGNAISHASCKIYVGSDPVPYTGVKSIDYEHKLDPGKFKGTNPGTTRRTIGDYEASGNIEMRIDEADRLIQRLGDGWMAKPVFITVTRIEENMVPITDELHAVRLTSSGTSSAEGNEPVMRKFALDIILLVENGILPYPGAIIPEVAEV